MKTILLSLMAASVLWSSSFAGERREVDVQLLLKLSRDAGTAAETIRQSGLQIPKPLAIRRSILALSERITRTSREWPALPASGEGLQDACRQDYRQRAAKMMEDTENLVEAIRSLKNSAEATRDARTAQEARRMIAVVWTLRVTVRRLQRELGDPGVTRMARSARR